MTDKFNSETRSYTMSRIKSKNTYPEIILRKALWSNGFKGYRINYNLTGKPDIVYTKKKLLIFIDGCFWHGCPICYRRPKSNTDYWDSKVANNMKRDKEVNSILAQEGWTVLRFWEHEIYNSLDYCIKIIASCLHE